MALYISISRALWGFLLEQTMIKTYHKKHFSTEWQQTHRQFQAVGSVSYEGHTVLMYTIGYG